MLDFSNYNGAHAAFAEYQVDLSEDQYSLFDRFARLMIAESQFQNITAVIEYQEIWIRHFLDSAYLLRFLPAHGKLIDIGTGGGVPAIPLAILCDSLQITLLDSEERKVDFCHDAARELGLDVQCLCGRAEELAKCHSYREHFDIATSRAMANGSMLTELSVPFLKIGGKLYAMKGRNYDAAVERFSEAAEKMGAIQYLPVHSYEIAGEQKHLIVLEKTCETSEQYPRRFAKIKRNPL